MHSIGGKFERQDRKKRQDTAAVGREYDLPAHSQIPPCRVRDWRLNNSLAIGNRKSAIQYTRYRAGTDSITLSAMRDGK